MSTPFRLSRWQFFLLSFFASFCMTPFSFVGLLTRMNRHIWLASAAQLLVTLTGSVGVALLLERFAGQSIQQIATSILGRFGGRIYLCLLLLYFLAWVPLANQTVVIRIVQSVDMPLTNPYLISTAMLLSAAYAAWFGPEVIGRVLEIWAFIFFPGSAFLAVIPLLHGQMVRLLPLAVRTDFFADPEFWSFALGLRGFILVLSLAGSAKPGKSLIWPLLGSGILANLLVAVLVIMPNTLFYPNTLKHFQFPTLDALDTIAASIIGIQSFLSLTLSVWHVINWAVAAGTLFSVGYLLTDGRNPKSHRWLILLLAPLCSILSGHPLMIATRAFWIPFWSLLGYIVGVAGPWGLLLLAWIRQIPRRREVP